MPSFQHSSMYLISSSEVVIAVKCAVTKIGTKR